MERGTPDGFALNNLPRCTQVLQFFKGFSSGTRIPRCARCSTKPSAASLAKASRMGLAPTSYRGNNSRIFNFVPGDHAPETMSLRNRSAANSDCSKSSDSVGKLYLARNNHVRL
jgi:hypothetical protein